MPRRAAASEFEPDQGLTGCRAVGGFEAPLSGGFAGETGEILTRALADQVIFHDRAGVIDSDSDRHFDAAVDRSARSCGN